MLDLPNMKNLGWRTDGPVPGLQLPLVRGAGLLGHFQALEECPDLRGIKRLTLFFIATYPI